MFDRGSAPQWPQAALPHLARLTTLGELTVLIAHELSQPLAAIAANGRASLQWLNGAHAWRGQGPDQRAGDGQQRPPRWANHPAIARAFPKSCNG